ncbi:hypothetical protein NSQ93_13250 [Bacillus sp. FSL W8-0445]|jgi:hypothetical protein|uniref:Uncharacterized protein n=1 Tax=Bacillus licheniformis TaxID=1402 RepID=A0AB37H0H6_BACLI|nr:MULTISPECIES: hypothetical protein [Bacillus subtilis group]MBJ7883912.1 hypothetical protein [Bacillaceae bacterium HSR45]ARW43505.1 hypothetical protein S100141_02185 [Bacillus licheniformis]MCM3434759.1 hypothetical protein [Bacillus licheniformis]MCM3463271.1 hypothetical protein [Bacillus licheniformis]MDE1386966.1 hypothetical protein [Bacillus licheniformis]
MENEELNLDFAPQDADCWYIYCSTNTCGPGRQATIEYCNGPDRVPYKQHCGCGYFA